MKKKKVLSIILNLIIIVSSSYAIWMLMTNGQGNMTENGLRVFRYYTVDSNVVAIISSLFVIFNNKTNKKHTILRFISVVTITVTFVTCVLFLQFVYGAKGIFGGTNMILHLTTPVLSLISFIFLEKGNIDKKYLFIGQILQIIYGFVYGIEVLLTKKWPDFYMFAYNGRTLISIVLMCTGTFIISILVSLAHSKFSK